MDEFDALELREAFHGWLLMDAARRERTGSAIRGLLEAQLPGGVEAAAMDAARHGDHEDALRTFDRFLALSPEAREGAEGREMAALLKAWMGPPPEMEEIPVETGIPASQDAASIEGEVPPLEPEDPETKGEDPPVEEERPPVVDEETQDAIEAPPQEPEVPRAVIGERLPGEAPCEMAEEEAAATDTAIILVEKDAAEVHTRSRIMEEPMYWAVLVVPVLAAFLLTVLISVALRRRRKRNRLLRRAALHRQRRQEYLASQQRQSVTPRGSIYS